MTAPARIVYAARNTYRLDPYVRDTAGRFAPKPATTPPPIAVLESSGTVRSEANGAVLIGPGDDRNRWTVRCVRDEDGTFRVIYLED